MRRARIAGHICLDLLPRVGTAIPPPGGLAETGPLDMRLGGCVANTGLVLAALGVPVELVAAIGDDLLGEAVAALLSGRGGVGSTLHRVAGRGTSYSIVIEVPGEDRRFLHHVGANGAFDPAAVPVTDTDLLHVGYPQLLPSLLDDAGAGLAGLLHRARVAGVATSVDFATADPATGRLRDWPAIVRRWAPLVDLLSPSVDDLRPVFPAAFTAGRHAGTPRTADALAGELVRSGVAVALVTAGAAGMCLRTSDAVRLRDAGQPVATLPAEWADRQLWAPATVADPVRTTGAGDAATAGMLAGLLRGASPEEALRSAATTAARYVSGIEPSPGWADRVDAGPAAAVPDAASAPGDGWTPATHGLMHGPLDGRGSP
jgi:sugar/nucleoside kinase (ribokinase family)